MNNPFHDKLNRLSNAKERPRHFQILAFLIASLAFLMLLVDTTFLFNESTSDEHSRIADVSHSEMQSVESGAPVTSSTNKQSCTPCDFAQFSFADPLNLHSLDTGDCAFQVFDRVDQINRFSDLDGLDGDVGEEGKPVWVAFYGDSLLKHAFVWYYEYLGSYTKTEYKRPENIWFFCCQRLSNPSTCTLTFHLDRAESLSRLASQKFTTENHTFCMSWAFSYAPSHYSYDFIQLANETLAPDLISINPSLWTIFERESIPQFHTLWTDTVSHMTRFSKIHPRTLIVLNSMTGLDTPNVPHRKQHMTNAKILHLQSIIDSVQDYPKQVRRIDWLGITLFGEGLQKTTDGIHWGDVNEDQRFLSIQAHLNFLWRRDDEIGDRICVRPQ